MNNIEKILEKEYSFYNKLDKEEKDDFWRDLSILRKNNILKEDLEVNGVGTNKIKLNEYNYSSFDLTKLKTLYEVDYEEFLFKKSENPNIYEDYDCDLPSVFYRMIYKEKFFQGELTSLNLFVYDEIVNELTNFVDKIFNTETDFDFDFKKIEDSIYSTVSFNNNFYFNEEKCEIFDKWFFEYKNNFYKTINLNNEKKFKNKCFIEKKIDFENEEIINIIFSNAEVCKNINFETFMEDVEENSGSFLLIENFISENFEIEKKVILNKIKEIFNQD